MSANDGLELNVTMPAGELAGLKRRVRYLEATIIQVMRGTRGIKEWFSSAELAELRLPSLPGSKAAITRVARDQRWMARHGFNGNEYHFSTLPRKAFEALIDRVVAPLPNDTWKRDQVPAIAAPEPEPVAESVATQPWLLPLLRVLRTEAPSSVREAVELLPEYLPKGAPVPSIEEAAAALHSFGMVS